MTSGPYRYLAALRAGGFPIRAYFSVGVIIILIPALLLSAWLASLSAASKREQIEQSIQQKVRATAVGVVIDRSDASLRVTIDDNGCGFDSAAGTSGGLGLAGMRERLSLIGGTLEIESSIGSGTTVFVRIPLEGRTPTA